MTRRLTSAVPWLAVLTMTAVVYVVSSCGGASDVANDGPDSANADSVADVAQVGEATGPPAGRPELLSDWGQLDVRDGQLTAADGVVSYSLNSALFSDYAHKLRTLWLPAGSGPAEYSDQDVFAFPVGTVITKTFYFPVVEGGVLDGGGLDGAMTDEVLKVAQSGDTPAAPLDLATVRLLETRVLVHRADGWDALPYVWNDDQSEATLARVGELIDLTLVDDIATDSTAAETEFTYVVPNVNQCASCHAENHTSGVIQPIGPKARHLNRTIDLGDGAVSQLDVWRELGLLANAPAEAPASVAWQDASAPLDQRARAYLDINCAHCHNSAGTADTSGLFLEASSELGLALGICKLPIAAGTGTGGRRVGIHPGEPDESIFVFRMQTTDPASMMPELGRSLTHSEGVDLISAWITSLDGDC